MGILQRMYLRGHLVGCVGWGNGATGLKNNLTFVVVFVDEMNRDARFRFARRHNGFVDTMTEHALAAKFWQKGRMNVYDSTGKGLNQRRRNQPHESRQHNQIDLLGFQ